MDILTKLSQLIDNAIQFLGIYGPLLGCFLIIIESIVPILPLFVFITLNFLSFGKPIGFLISWICTIAGCMISFFLFRKGFRKWFVNRVRKHTNVDILMGKMESMKFQHLVTIIAIPFMPAFAINIAAALSKMNSKKFFLAIVIGKIFLVYFWGFIGTSLYQSLTNPQVLIKVIIATIIAYIASVIVNKKFKLD